MISEAANLFSCPAMDGVGVLPSVGCVTLILILIQLYLNLQPSLKLDFND